MSETCPTCGRDVDSFDLTQFGQPIRTAYWHPGLDAFAADRCDMPLLGPGSVYGCATVAEAALTCPRCSAECAPVAHRR